MDTPKAILAGLAVTLGLLAATYGLEGLAQLAGPEEVEVESEEGSEAEEAEEEIDVQEDDGGAEGEPEDEGTTEG